MIKIRTITVLLAFVMMISLCGCFKPINYDLPENPVKFKAFEFINPNNPDDGFMAIQYNGRTYVPYGGLKGFINGDDVGKCLGYAVQNDDTSADINLRIYTLNADSECNYLMEYYTSGIMENPFFLRAIDTLGKDIDTPKFIDSLDYDYWKDEK